MGKGVLLRQSICSALDYMETKWSTVLLSCPVDVMG